MSDREQWRRERREIVRRHHPDVGGDPEAMLAELEALDRRHRPAPVVVVTTAPSTTTSLLRSVRRARRVARNGSRRVRAAVPRGWPGHRRHHDI